MHCYLSSSFFSCFIFLFLGFILGSASLLEGFKMGKEGARVSFALFYCFLLCLNSNVLFFLLCCKRRVCFLFVFESFKGVGWDI